MWLRFQLFFFILVEVGMEDCWSLWKMILFKYFLPLWFVSSRFWAGLGADHTLFYKNKKSVLWLILLVFFWGWLQSIMSIFCHLCPFTQVCEQYKAWLILELHEMLRVWHIFAYPSVLLLLCDLGRQAGVLKLLKKAQSLVFLAVWVLFLKFFTRLGIHLLELYAIFTCVTSCFYFGLWSWSS